MTGPAPLIYLETLGCPKNKADSRQIRGMLTEGGYAFTDSPGEASVIILNTCGFIDAAKEESIQRALELARWKKDGLCRLLVMFGCLVQRHGAQLARAMPEVDLFLGVFEWETLLDRVSEFYKDTHTQAEAGKKAAVSEVSADKPAGKLFARPGPARDYRAAWSVASPQSHTGYIKIAEGCPRRCAFCVIPGIRGGYRSRARSDIIEEVSLRVAHGLREAVIVAQDTGYYGKDLKPAATLAGLIRELSDIGGLQWIRVMYCCPEEVDDELIEAMRLPKVCPYLDIPFQHIDDDILRRMGRTTDSGMIKGLMEKLRARVEGIVIRTTLMVGFPGETEKAFLSLMDFLDEYHPERAGFFAFSPQEGTPAKGMKGQIPGLEKERRLDLALAKRDLILARWQDSLVGKTISVIVDKAEGDGIGSGSGSRDYDARASDSRASDSSRDVCLYEGRSIWDAPDIDGLVCFSAKAGVRAGDIVKVKITHSSDYILTGEIENESCQ